MSNNMLKKYQNFINEEVGLRDISKFAKLHKTAEIYFHKDLDGVTSALAMKEFLKNYYQIETVDCHIIQYGGLEYAIKPTKRVIYLFLLTLHTASQCFISNQTIMTNKWVLKIHNQLILNQQGQMWK